MENPIVKCPCGNMVELEPVEEKYTNYSYIAKCDNCKRSLAWWRGDEPKKAPLWRRWLIKVLAFVGKHDI